MPAATPRPRRAIYVRVSTKQQKLREQFAQLRKLAEARGRARWKTLGNPALGLARDTGFEPMAFGSGVGQSTLAVGANGSQPLANIGCRVAANGTRFPDLAAFRPPLGTSLVQSEIHCQALPRCLTVKEAAKALRVSPATVYRLVAEGRVAHAPVSNAIRISEKDVEALLGSRS
jgi:excisionase family DNA binding protein